MGKMAHPKGRSVNTALSPGPPPVLAFPYLVCTTKRREMTFVFYKLQGRQKGLERVQAVQKDTKKGFTGKYRRRASAKSVQGLAG